MAIPISNHFSNRMKLEWHSKLHPDMAPAKNYRKTSIICTIGVSPPNMVVGGGGVMERTLPNCRISGPKTNSVEKMNMLRKGMDQCMQSAFLPFSAFCKLTPLG
jgi:pyruvate kinase